MKNKFIEFLQRLFCAAVGIGVGVLGGLYNSTTGVVVGFLVFLCAFAPSDKE